MKLLISREKLGDYLLDLSKIIFAGVVIDGIVNSAYEYRVLLTAFGILIFVAISIIGLILANKKGG